MHALAQFIMRNPLSAALVAASSAVLSLLLPPLLFISGGTIALVCLRKGFQQGILVVVLASIGTGLLAYLSIGVALPAILLALLHWLPLLILALALRATISLAMTLQFAAVLGGLGVLAFYLLLGDPAIWWMNIIDQSFKDFEAAGVLSEPELMNQLRRAFETWAPLLPGQAISSLLLSSILALLLGRWWQSLLYYPGGFREEFHALRLGLPLAVIMAVLMGLSLALGWPIIVNLTLVVGLICTLHGVALVHALATIAKVSKAWLVLFYLLLFIVLSQLVLVLALVDAWADFRSRIKSSRK
jgi:hypothetical protein